jgi:PiT family inorganic phosphate transporter
VRWSVARRIVWAWLITIPAAAVIAAITYWLVASRRHGVALLAAALIVLAIAIVALAFRRTGRGTTVGERS